jgi:hypothetical protein
MSIFTHLTRMLTQPLDQLVNLLWPDHRPVSGVDADLNAARDRER